MFSRYETKLNSFDNFSVDPQYQISFKSEMRHADERMDRQTHRQDLNIVYLSYGA
jgi:hypothetical protein